MTRLHVHIAVDDLDRSVAFYSHLFAAGPVRREADYAKWALDDPRVNFAISTRGKAAGLEHLGIEAESPDELAEVYARLEAADAAMVEEGDTVCCYARSEKSWVADPAGVPWEVFRTYGDSAVYGDGVDVSSARLFAENAAPSAAGEPATASAGSTPCCGPTQPA